MCLGSPLPRSPLTEKYNTLNVGQQCQYHFWMRTYRAGSYSDGLCCGCEQGIKRVQASDIQKEAGDQFPNTLVDTALGLKGG